MGKLLLACIALAFVLSGCSTPQASASGSPSASAIRGESARPTPSSERPVLAFDGKCESALTDSEVSQAVGASVSLTTQGPSVYVWAVQQLGGIACSWGEASTGDLVWMTLIPAAAAGAQVAKQDEAQPHCYGGDVAAGESDACSFGAVIGPWWFAGVAYTAAGSHLRSVDAIAALTAALSPRLSSEQPLVPTLLPGTWSSSIDCDAVASAAALSTVLGDPALTGGDGTGAAEFGPGVTGALAATGYRSCIWNDSGATNSHAFTIEVIPGAAWVISQGGVTGGRSVGIAGTTAALEARPPGAQVTFLYVTDGTNLLILEPDLNVTIDTLTPAVQPIMQALAGAS